MLKRYLLIVLLTALLTSCTDVTTSVPTESTENTPSPASETGSQATALEAESTTELTVEPTPTPLQESATAPHPVEQLISSFAAIPQTNGNALILFGQVLDVNGEPVPDAVVEIWQTDANGIYDHPDDQKTNSRDMSFQFFGTAPVGEDGWYIFRTILPGQYEPRPRHIHYKVKQNGQTMLTSQFYFSEDIATVEGEGMFQAVGDDGDLLLLQLMEREGTTLANGRIVVDTGIGSGTLPLTPSQGEGPFYPVVPVADFDNDLLTQP